jgi:hypothetical protein
MSDPVPHVADTGIHHTQTVVTRHRERACAVIHAAPIADARTTKIEILTRTIVFGGYAV